MNKKQFFCGVIVGLLLAGAVVVALTPWRFYTSADGRILWRVNRLSGQAAWSSPTSLPAIWHHIGVTNRPAVDANGFEIVSPP